MFDKPFKGATFRSFPLLLCKRFERQQSRGKDARHVSFSLRCEFYVAAQDLVSLAAFWAYPLAVPHPPVRLALRLLVAKCSAVMYLSSASGTRQRPWKATAYSSIEASTCCGHGPFGYFNRVPTRAGLP